MKSAFRTLAVCVLAALTVAPAAALAPSADLADPIWCPVGVTPVSGSPRCSPNYGALRSVLIWLDTNDPNVAGVIWLGRAYDSALEGGDNFVFDGDDFVNLDNHPLTIQGGWNGLGTTTVNHSDPSEFNGDYLHFFDWHAPVTINDVLVDGSTHIGLWLNTTGDINLSHVDARNNVSHGAALSNYLGTGNITVSDSTFEDNANEGLSAGSAGAITLNNVTANHNGSNYDGAALDNRSSTTAQPVTLNGTNVFNDNGSGLMVFSDGPIVLHEIMASRNSIVGAGSGAYLDNDEAASPQPVSVLGATHQFVDNAMGGLAINSHGPITAENILATGNGFMGGQMHNGGAGGAGGVMLTGNNAFMNNGANGLISGSNGAIALFGVTASGNDWNGVRMTTPSSASLNCGKIYSNTQYGIEAGGVAGPLTLSDVAFDLFNGSGNYLYTGAAAITTGGCALAAGLDSPMPMRAVLKYVSGSPIALDCSIYGGTQVVIRRDGRVIFHCPTVGEAVVYAEQYKLLPAPLPDGRRFVSGLTIALSDGGKPQPLTPGLTTLSFALPKNAKINDFIVLYWTGKQWIDLNEADFEGGATIYDGGTLTGDGYIEASVNFTGSFVLTSQ